MAKGVGRRALAGITWTFLGEVVANITRIVGVALLGRLLTPADFGVVAVAMTIVLFAGRFKELGLNLALVQRKDINDDHIATTFGFSLLLGSALAIAIFIAAGPLAVAYGMPAAASAIRALSALFVIRALSSVPRALMQRELQFKTLAWTNVSGYIVGTIVSVVLALGDTGPWALIIGYIAEAAVECLLTLAVQPLGMRPRINRRALGELVGFGGGHTVSSLANYFATQGDNIVVGKYLGVDMLGLYDRAYVLMRFPAQVFTSIAGTVLFSSFARLQDDPPRLGLVFRRVVFATAIVLMPASAGLIVLAPEVIRILLGSGWDSVVLPFQIMAASMLFRTTYKVPGLVARSSGAVIKIAAAQVLYAIAVIGGALFSMRWGIVGVSITTSLAVVFHFTNLTRLALRQVPLGWMQVVTAHLDGLVMAALAVAGSLPVAIAMRAHHGGTTLVAVTAVAAGMVPPVCYALLRIRQGAEDWAWVVERVRQVGRKKAKNRAIATTVPADE